MPSKFGLLKYSRSRNFGDQVQSLAAKQYLPQVEEYVDRDFLNEYKADDSLAVIMNGWYMAKPENWPPSEKIKPLMLSFHVSHDYDAHEKLFTDEAIRFYKKNEPIGCRDHFTLKLMTDNGVRAYYSGCLTLTLKRGDYSNQEQRGDKVYLVDVLYKVRGRGFKFFKKWKQKWLANQLVPPHLRDKVEWITQIVSKTESEKGKFQLAHETLQKYANAKLVITSRIHCALPCTAFGTPVVFVDGALDELTDTTRLSGIQEYFRVFKAQDLIKSYRGFLKELFSRKEFKNPLGIDWNNPPENPSKHQDVVVELRKKCSSFVEDIQTADSTSLS